MGAINANSAAILAAVLLCFVGLVSSRIHQTSDAIVVEGM